MLDRLLYWDLRRWGFESRTELVGGVALQAYERVPRGWAARNHKSPPVVFLHGIGANLTHWHQPALAMRWWSEDHLWLLDLPGHGHSGLPGTTLTPDLVQQLLEGWLEKTLGTEPFVLVGHSMGGALALRFALEHPGRLVGLVLVSPAVGFEEPLALNRMIENFRIQDRQGASLFLNKVIPRLPWYLGLVRPMLVGLTRAVMQSRGVSDIRQSVKLQDFERGRDIHSLRIPTLIVWGQLERILPPSSKVWLKQYAPDGAQWWEPEGAGHCPQIDQGSAFARRLRAFIRELV